MSGLKFTMPADAIRKTRGAAESFLVDGFEAMFEFVGEGFPEGPILLPPFILQVNGADLIWLAKQV